MDKPFTFRQTVSREVKFVWLGILNGPTATLIHNASTQNKMFIFYQWKKGKERAHTWRRSNNEVVAIVVVVVVMFWLEILCHVTNML